MRTKKSQPDQTVVRVISNDGQRAIVEFPDGNIITVRRLEGSFQHVFADEFLRLLPVGRLTRAEYVTADRVIFPYMTWLASTERAAEQLERATANQGKA
jgi:hypothetical protein